MTPEKELLQKIIKILAQYYELKGMPAGEWNRIEAIIKYNKSEWCKAQRENCWNELKKVDYWFSHEKGIQNIIESTPEP